MSCQPFAEALVDESLPRPAGLQAHLEGCAGCRALARAQRSATSLRLPPPPQPAPIGREAILKEVRRRQHRRRTVASVGATAALALLVLLAAPRLGSGRAVDAETVGGPGELALSVEPPSRRAPSAEVARAEVVSLGVLFEEVHGYTRTQPSVEDALYRPFGALSAWVRPPESTALEAEPFRTALAAFHLTQSR